MNVIANAYATFAEKVLPAGAGLIQRIEVKRAFYAGAASLLAALMGGMSPGADVEASDEALVEGIQAELVKFNDEIKAGTA